MNKVETSHPDFKDITPLSRAISLIFPRLVINEFFIGPMGEKVPFEARKRDEEEMDIFGRRMQTIGYVRVGDVIFLDNRAKGFLHPDITEPLKDNIIWLWRFGSTIGEYTHLLYAQLAIYALSAMDLKGKRVLDLGVADGVLGLVAHRRGAAKVFSVEINGQNQWVYDNHISVNGLPQSSFDFMSGDITRPNTLISKLQDQKVEVVIANIGPTYDDVHLAAIALASSLPTVQTFIGGGYIKDHPEMNSIQAIQLLKQHGFERNFRELSFRRYHQAFIVDKHE